MEKLLLGWSQQLIDTSMAMYHKEIIMIETTNSGYHSLTLAHLVLDYNGSLAIDDYFSNEVV